MMPISLDKPRNYGVSIMLLLACFFFPLRTEKTRLINQKRSFASPFDANRNYERVLIDCSLGRQFQYEHTLKAKRLSIQKTFARLTYPVRGQTATFIPNVSRTQFRTSVFKLSREVRGGRKQVCHFVGLVYIPQVARRARPEKIYREVQRR